MPTWLLIIVCIFCWGTWALTEKLSLKYMSPMMVTIVGMYVYSALAPLLFLYMKARGITTEWSAKGIGWATVTCLLAAAAGLSFLHAIQRTQVHLVVGFTAVYPVLTFLLCWIFLGEPVTAIKLFGIASIVLGTVLLSM